MRTFGLLALFLVFLVPLGGCASRSSALADSLRAISQSESVDQKTLRPDLIYLRSETDGHVALFVLGYVDPHPQGAIEVWYSGAGEVLRLQNGRIVGTAGLTPDWHEVRLANPPDLKSIGAPTLHERERDEMPGYRFNLRERLLIQPAPPPTESRLRHVDPQRLRWLEETVEHPRNALPPSRFALAPRTGEVLYTEQCLTPTLCFAFQRWPARQPD